MVDEILHRKKERIPLIKKDLEILYKLTESSQNSAIIKELEEKTGAGYEQKIAPLLRKYDLIIHRLNRERIVWKPKISEVIKDLETEWEESEEYIKKRSSLHNPNPWLLRIITGAIIAGIAGGIGYIIGRLG